MAMRQITSSFAGRCSACNKMYPAGTKVWWARGQGTRCAECGDGNGESEPQTTITEGMINGWATAVEDYVEKENAAGVEAIAKMVEQKVGVLPRLNARMNFKSAREAIQGAVVESGAMIVTPQSKQTTVAVKEPVPDPTPPAAPDPTPPSVQAPGKLVISEDEPDDDDRVDELLDLWG